MEKTAQGNDVINAWLESPTLDVGNFPLCHSHRLSQFGLVQVGILAQIADAVSESQFHKTTPRPYFAIDGNFLLTIRHKISIMKVQSMLRKEKGGSFDEKVGIVSLCFFDAFVVDSV